MRNPLAMDDQGDTCGPRDRAGACGMHIILTGGDVCGSAVFTAYELQAAAQKNDPEEQWDVVSDDESSSPKSVAPLPVVPRSINGRHAVSKKKENRKGKLRSKLPKVSQRFAVPLSVTFTFTLRLCIWLILLGETRFCRHRTLSGSHSSTRLTTPPPSGCTLCVVLDA